MEEFDSLMELKSTGSGNIAPYLLEQCGDDACLAQVAQTKYQKGM
jgi:hypothetical protein